MLVPLALLGVVRAYPIGLESFPVAAVAEGFSCVDPNGCRTLWDIIRSCLFTIILCTWVSVHPNIPGPRDEWPMVVLRRVGIMLAVLIAPEFILVWAIRQRDLARHLADKHGKDHEWTVTHGFFAAMGGFMEYDGNEPVQTLLPEQLEGYSLTGTGDFPRIAVEDIEDKSKGDIVSKGLVVLQTGWFVLQCVARGVQGLRITELELVTIAFACLSLLMYWSWWNKPLNVRCAVRVYKKRDLHNPGKDQFAKRNVGGFWTPLRSSLSELVAATTRACHENGWKVVLQVVLWPLTKIGRIIADTKGDAVIKGEKRIYTFYPRLSMKVKSGPITLVFLPAVSVLFGAIHCVAWSFAPPSETERILWRIHSVIITGMPAVLVFFTVVERSGHKLRKTPIGLGLYYGLFSVYAISRLFLLFLAFASLRALPPNAYLTVRWTMLIPHV